MSVYKAMLIVQGRITGAKRDAKNTHFKNNYATLESVWNTIRPPLQDAGLVVIQKPGRVNDGLLSITTLIVHAESGEELENIMEIPVTKSDAQGLGSALTYGCRYSLMALFGLPPTDDDGEAARTAHDGEAARKKDPAIPQNWSAGYLEWHAENARHVPPEYVRAVNNHWPSIQCIKDAIAIGDLPTGAEAWSELTHEEKTAIWRAPTEGGCFTINERRVLKGTEFREAHPSHIEEITMGNK